MQRFITNVPFERWRDSFTLHLRSFFYKLIFIIYLSIYYFKTFILKVKFVTCVYGYGIIYELYHYDLLYHIWLIITENAIFKRYENIFYFFSKTSFYFIYIFEFLL